MSIAATLQVFSFSPSTGGVSLCVGNTGGNMDLAAQEVGVEGQPGRANGAWRLSYDWQEENEGRFHK